MPLTYGGVHPLKVNRFSLFNLSALRGAYHILAAFKIVFKKNRRYVKIRNNYAKETEHER